MRRRERQSDEVPLPGSVALVATALCVVKFIPAKTRVQRLKKGRDGEQIHIATRTPETAPIIQCKAEAADIKLLPRDSTTNTYPVRGVVVFLDGFVNRRPSARGADIRVLNPSVVALLEMPARIEHDAATDAVAWRHGKFLMARVKQIAP